MAKVAGSYESVVRGVSEQVPQDRRSGQHHTQDNMISDPVRGLARRHGSRLLDEQSVGSSLDMSALLADTRYHRVTTFFVDGREFDMIYRSAPDATAPLTALAFCFDRAAGTFVPVTFCGAADQFMTELRTGGVSAAVNMGRYLLLAGNTTTAEAVSTPKWDAPGNKSRYVVWVRGGAYSRTFKVKVRKAGGSVEASYKTLSSSYPTLLSTTDIPTSDPNYQQLVNDRVHAYNSEVTKWIGTAAADITPENIAAKLAADLTAKGIAGVSVIGGSVLFTDDSVTEITVEDGGDGTLLRAVGNEVTAPELVSTVHHVGKVVKVRPSKSNGNDAFYLIAVAKSQGETGWAEVSWRETAGYEMQPSNVVALATIHEGVCYIGEPAALEAQVGFDVPGFKANAVGDQISSPLPAFFGKTIDYLGMFQDRLLIGCGAIIMGSRPGDYFNWFRESVLTLTDSDPWEGYALGSEDDVIRYSTTYDRNLLLYGKRFQYTISGRVPLTPKTASIVIASSYEDAIDAAPQASGNFVFYGKFAGEPGAERASLHQVQAGAIADSPESYDASQQLDGYIKGRPVEIVALTAPNMVALRTDADRNVLYTYTYLDNANASERLFDSWSRWVWNEVVGNVVGVSSHDGGLIVYMLRRGGSNAWITAERFVRDTGKSPLPYLDSLRPLADYFSAPVFADPSYVANASVAFPQSGWRPLMGEPMDRLAVFQAAYPTHYEGAYVGVNYPAGFTPTNPFLRDRNDKAILSGRLTLGRVIISFADTGGMRVEVNTSSGTKVPLDFNGRILGHSSNQIGHQPVLTTSLSAVVGREVRECTYSVMARTWLPLTVTAIEWTGQSFNKVRRV